MDTASEKLNTPLVSITMPAYNAGSFIQETINSVLQQTYSKWELIIVDDGSSDNTLDILNTYEDPRIKIFKHEQNSGVVATRNTALKHAQGTYIAILDSDDVWIDTAKLEKQVSFMEKHPQHGIVGTNITHIDEKGELVGKTLYVTDNIDIRSRILITNQFAHSTVLIRKSVLDKIGGYRDFAPADDLELIMRIGKVSQFANLPIFSTKYRIHSGGISKTGKKKMASQIVRIITLYRHDYPSSIPALIKAYIRHILLFLHLR